MLSSIHLKFADYQELDVLYQCMANAILAIETELDLILTTCTEFDVCVSKCATLIHILTSFQKASRSTLLGELFYKKTTLFEVYLFCVCV